MSRSIWILRLQFMVILLIYIGLMTLLLRSTSYFSLNNQSARSQQVANLTQTLTRQMAYSLVPLLENSDNTPQITAFLEQLTSESQVLDASVYQLNGVLVAHSGETTRVQDRLVLNDRRNTHNNGDTPDMDTLKMAQKLNLNYQRVEPIVGKEGPLGFLRLTLSTQLDNHDLQQDERIQQRIRLLILAALIIGIVIGVTAIQPFINRRASEPD